MKFDFFSQNILLINKLLKFQIKKENKSLDEQQLGGVGRILHC